MCREIESSTIRLWAVVPMEPDSHGGAEEAGGGVEGDGAAVAVEAEAGPTDSPILLRN